MILGCLRLDCALNVITGMLERWKVCVYTYESPTQAWTPNTNTDTVNIQNIQYQDTPHNHWLWHEHCHTVNVQNIGYHDTTHTHNQHGKICSPKNKVKLYNFHMIMTLTKGYENHIKQWKKRGWRTETQMSATPVLKEPPVAGVYWQPQMVEAWLATMENNDNWHRQKHRCRQSPHWSRELLTSNTKTGFHVQRCLCSMEERVMRFIIF